LITSANPTREQSGGWLFQIAKQKSILPEYVLFLMGSAAERLFPRDFSILGLNQLGRKAK
jgi:hypothetical protein